MNCIVLLSLLVTVALVADEGAPAAIPAGAVPFEETIDLETGKLNPPATSAHMAKNAGYKLQKDGEAILVGPWKSTLSTGELTQAGFYDNTGKMTGVWKWYAPDGKVMRQLSFKDGLPHGLLIGFHPDGMPAFIGWNANGKPDGISVNIAPDGKIVHVDQRKAGELIKSIDADGSPPPPVAPDAFLK